VVVGGWVAVSGGGGSVVVVVQLWMWCVVVVAAEVGGGRGGGVARQPHTFLSRQERPDAKRERSKTEGCHGDDVVAKAIADSHVALESMMKSWP
jgi:hypothetical protein